MNVHSTFTCYRQKLKATQISINRWVGNQIVVRPSYNTQQWGKYGTLSSQCISKTLRWVTRYKRSTYYVIPFIWKSMPSAMTESRSIFACGRHCLGKGTRKIWGIMERFYVITVFTKIGKGIVTLTCKRPQTGSCSFALRRSELGLYLQLKADAVTLLRNNWILNHMDWLWALLYRITRFVTLWMLITLSLTCKTISYLWNRKRGEKKTYLILLFTG